MRVDTMPQEKEFDVVVVGGGVAGVAAAVAAARLGASTALVEQGPCLGGTATQANMLTFDGYCIADGSGQPRYVVGGVPLDILSGLRALGDPCVPVRSPSSGNYIIPFNGELLKCVLDSLALDAGVQLFLYTTLVGVIRTRDNLRIAAIRVHHKQGESLFAGKEFIDATGDADVVYFAGLPFQFGDEVGKTQPVTLNVLIGPVHRETTSSMSKEEFLGHLEASGFLQNRSVRFNGMFYPTGLPQVVVLNGISLSGVDGTSAVQMTSAIVAARKMAYEIVEAIRRVVPGFEEARLLASGPVLGVRDSRRLVGQYLLTEEDILSERSFDDAIAWGGWPVKVEGATGDQHKRYRSLLPGHHYEIPLRCLQSAHLGNLGAAGRCISTNFLAQTSTRVMATAMATGQAAGIAAARRSQGAPSGNALTQEVQAVLDAWGVPWR